MIICDHRSGQAQVREEKRFGSRSGGHGVHSALRPTFPFAQFFRQYSSPMKRGLLHPIQQGLSSREPTKNTMAKRRTAAIMTAKRKRSASPFIFDRSM